MVAEHSNFFNRKPAATVASARVGFPAKNPPPPPPPKKKKKKRKPYSFHSVRSAIGRRMNGMIFCLFRKRHSSQKNTNTAHSEYSYSWIVQKERAHSSVHEGACARLLSRFFLFTVTEECRLLRITFFK